jgi:tRNA 2-selenouridine synthase
LPIAKLSIPEFISLSKAHPVIDVRSPGEHKHAHIPGAYSLPLFSDEERKIVGTAYKQESKQQAIRIGLEYFGKKMIPMLDEVTAWSKSFYSGQNDNTVIVHCWRGGMRSAGVAWLLDLYGFKVYTVVGGYKAYRNWVLRQFERDYDIILLGGYTGSGKTCLLNYLQESGKHIIDLEALALHKGSAFGALGMPQQPTQEMFENLLVEKLASASVGATESIWLEDESRRIGQVNIPAAFYHTMRSKQIFFIDIPFEERLQHIMDNYGTFDKIVLSEAILRIQKRLGGLETKHALNYLEEGDIKACFRILLSYYDKCYLKGLANRESGKEKIISLAAANVSEKENALALLRKLNSKHD